MDDNTPQAKRREVGLHAFQVVDAMRYQVGQHFVQVEQEDLVHLTFRGRMTGPDALRLKQVVFELGDRLGDYDFLVDLEQIDTFDAGGRAQFAHPERRYPFRATLLFGGNFAARMLIATIIRAGRLIAPRHFPPLIEFFATEADARARLDALRAARSSAP